MMLLFGPVAVGQARPDVRRYPLSRMTASVSGAGDRVGVQVRTSSDSPWSAATDAPWIAPVSPNGRVGPGTLPLLIAANPDPAPRMGTVTIADATFEVRQASTACSFSIAPQSNAVAPEGGTFPRRALLSHERERVVAVESYRASGTPPIKVLPRLALRHSPAVRKYYRNP
jgi:hypothetical protein